MNLSVIMPVFNCRKYIIASVESILKQTFYDFEFIIIDGNSTDGTMEIIKSYSDSRIKLFSNSNYNFVYSLNIGISKAKSKFIARMDSDDISDTKRLEKQYDFLKNNPDTVICSSYYNLITDEGSFIGVRKLPITDIEIKKVIKKWNPFCHPSVVFNKDIAVRFGGYPNFKNNEDWELWKNIIKYGKAHNIPEALLNYRIRNDSKSSIEKAQIIPIIIKVNSKEVNSFYNLRVGISFLENGKNKRQARYYIKKSFSVKFNFKYFYNYLLTYLPFTFIYFFKSLKNGFSYVKYIK